jgi:hypothetical protein
MSRLSSDVHRAQRAVLGCGQATKQLRDLSLRLVRGGPPKFNFSDRLFHAWEITSRSDFWSHGRTEKNQVRAAEEGPLPSIGSAANGEGNHDTIAEAKIGHF